MPGQRLKQFLDDERVKYISIQHSPAYTALEIAARAHISGKALAKSVVMIRDGQLCLAVLPASASVDVNRFQATTGAHVVALAKEADFRERFPDCELGAMPPFGHLYGLAVYVTPSLAEDAEIAFNAGTHRELIQLAYSDFDRLEKPKVADFEA